MFSSGKLLYRISCVLVFFFLGYFFALAPLPAPAQQTAIANPARIVAPVDDSVLTTLKGNVHPLANRKYDTGAAALTLAADRIQLVLKRSEGQEIALRQLLGSLQDPNSARYRKWLTPEEFGAHYGVSDADIKSVSTWLTSKGFRVDKVNKAHTILEFSGSIGQLQIAFHTQIHKFTVNGEEHLANISDPQIPSALTPVVTGISSLNNFFPPPPHTTPLPARYDEATRKFEPVLTTGSATGGYFLYVGPGDAGTIYDTPNSLNKNFTGTTTYTGTNVSIGIIGHSDIDLSDIANYRVLFGLPASAPNIVVDGNDPGTVSGWDIEALLDLEASGGLAPGASQTFYLADNTSFNPFYDFAISRALGDNAVSIVSVSVQTCERYLGRAGNQLIYNLWEQAAAQGITAVISSSDSGSAGCDNFDTQQQAQLGLQVNGLSSTPFNVSVGGTDYDVLGTDFIKFVSTTNRTDFGSALSFIPENPWNDSTTVNGALTANVPNNNIVAGSGGISGCVSPDYDAFGGFLNCGPAYAGSALTGWAKPSWQTGGSLNIPADGVRDLPDVSLLAGDGYYNAAWLICTDDIDGNGHKHNCANDNGYFYFSAVGGTSASAPAFAGILALVSQSQGGARLGQVNYVLYNLANQASVYSAAFHDVTTGNNSVYCLAGSLNCGTNLFETGYDAGVGYDLASGLGSVDVTQLIGNWIKAAFTPSTTVFTINGGTGPVSINHGDTVTFNATVSGAAGTPTGEVAVLSNANQQVNTYAVNGIRLLTLSGGTTGPTSFSNLPGGSYTVSANYGGDITFAQSQSTPGIQVTVAKENSVLNLLAQNFNGNVAPGASYSYGTYITFDAQPVGQSQLNSQTPAYATGSVTFNDTGGLPSTVSGTVALNSLGYAEFPVHYWSTTSHAVSASYAGDNSFNASTAMPIAFTITQAATTNAVTASSSTVGGSSFTVTSMIEPSVLSYATSPSGTVTLAVSGTVIGSGVLTATQDPNSGVSLAATIIAVDPSSLVAGTNLLTATYGGDANYIGSTGTVMVTYIPAAPAFVLTNTAATVSSPGQSGTSTITITPSGGYTGTVNLSCVLKSSPTGANATYNPTCSLSGSPVKITSATAGTATATFATTAPNSGALVYPQTNRWTLATGGAVLACVMFFGIPARRRGWRSMLGLLVFLATVAGVGCGGGSSHTNSTPGTSTGTYTFTVTGTDSMTSTTTESSVITVTVN